MGGQWVPLQCLMCNPYSSLWQQEPRLVQLHRWWGCHQVTCWSRMMPAPALKVMFYSQPEKFAYFLNQVWNSWINMVQIYLTRGPS